jgi:hypothetical protein
LGRKQEIDLEVFWVQVCQLQVGHCVVLMAFQEHRVGGTQVLRWTGDDFGLHTLFEKRNFRVDIA